VKNNEVHDLEQIVEWLAQTSDSMLTVLEKKVEIKNLLKDLRWKGDGNHFQRQTRTVDVDNLIDESIEGTKSGMKVIKETLTTSVSTMNTKLSELKVAGKGLLQSAISTANEFLNKFEEELDVTARQQSADQKEPEVDVTLNIEVTVKSVGSVPTSTQETTTIESDPLPSCLRDLKSHDLVLEARDGSDFSLSCKSMECKKCLLWFYLNSLTEGNSLETQNQQ